VKEKLIQSWRYKTLPVIKRHKTTYFYLFCTRLCKQWRSKDGKWDLYSPERRLSGRIKIHCSHLKRFGPEYAQKCIIFLEKGKKSPQRWGLRSKPALASGGWGQKTPNFLFPFNLHVIFSTVQIFLHR